jgi:hypothetical protein
MERCGKKEGWLVHLLPSAACYKFVFLFLAHFISNIFPGPLPTHSGFSNSPNVACRPRHLRDITGLTLLQRGFRVSDLPLAVDTINSAVSPGPTYEIKLVMYL